MAGIEEQAIIEHPQVEVQKGKERLFPWQE